VFGPFHDPVFTSGTRLAQPDVPTFARCIARHFRGIRAKPTRYSSSVDVAHASPRLNACRRMFRLLMSMKSMMMMPPRLRRRSCRAWSRPPPDCAENGLSVSGGRRRARVDVDGGHRFRWSMMRCPPDFSDTSGPGLLNLFLDMVQFEQRTSAAVHSRRGSASGMKLAAKSASPDARSLDQ